MVHEEVSARIHFVFPPLQKKILALDAPDLTLPGTAAELVFAAGQYAITDTGSAGGIFVDGTAIGRRLVPLSDQAVVRTDGVVFVYEAARRVDRRGIEDDAPTEQLPGS